MNKLTIAAALAAATMLSAAGPAPKTAFEFNMKTIDGKPMPFAQYKGKVLLIDIREKSEHLTGIAEGAILLPMSELAQKQSQISKDPSQPVLLICNTQNRSKATLNMLKQQGYQNVRYVEGGMSQWAAKGWPLVGPR